MEKPFGVTIHWKGVEQCWHFNVVLYVFQFYPRCDFRKFINFGIGTVRSGRRVNMKVNNFSVGEGEGGGGGGGRYEPEGNPEEVLDFLGGKIFEDVFGQMFI